VAFHLEVAERTALIHDGELAAWLDLPSRPNHPAPYIIHLLPPQLARPDRPDHVAIVTHLGRLEGVPLRGDLFGLLAIGRSGLRAFFDRVAWPWEEAAARPETTFDLERDLPEGSVIRPTLTGRALQALLKGRSGS
jgi:hypothetical protein